MRKNVKSLAPALWLVIAAFVIAIFAVWGGAGRLGEARAANTIATVGKVKISADIYHQNLRQRLEMMQREFRSLDRKLIQQLNIPQQILEQIIQQNLLLQTAQDMGIDVSAGEIRDKIISYPVFQKDGKFIGFEEYKKILEWNRISVTEFEKSLRKEVLLDKIIQLITAGIAVAEEEVWENYKKENESARLEYVLVEKEKIEMKDELPAKEIQQFFEENREKYKIPEKRQGEYIFFKTEDFKPEVKLDESDIEKYYKSNLTQFEEPEKIKVSRIYLPFEDKEKELIMAKAESILEKINKGEDFSELAKKNSKDEKGKDGGDWGYYDWKKFSSQEKEEIKKLSQGETSSALELEDGVSLLKVTEKKPTFVKPLEEVKERIRSILNDERARALAEEKIRMLEKNARKEKSLDIAAQKSGLKVKNTGPLEKGEALEDIDPSGTVSRTLFELKEKEITPPFYTYKGVGIAQLEKIDPPRLAKFEEVKDAARENLLKIKKKGKALEKIKNIKTKLRRMSMEKAAEKYNIEYKTAEEYKRGQYLSIIGESEEIDTLAFSLPLEEESEPIEFKNGYALIKVLDRKEVTQEDFEKNKKEEKQKLLEMKKSKFLHSYLMKLREVKGVKIKYDLFLKVNSEVLSRFGGEES